MMPKENLFFFTQYFVEAPLAAITASGLLGNDATSLAHLYLGSFSLSSLQILSSSVRLVGWGVSLNSYFQVSPEMSDQVQVRALAGPLKYIQRLVPKPLLLLAVCLRSLSCWKVNLCPQSEVLSTLEQVFIKDLSVLFSVHLSLDPD